MRRFMLLVGFLAPIGLTTLLFNLRPASSSVEEAPSAAQSPLKNAVALTPISPSSGRTSGPSYPQVIQSTAAMVSDGRAQKLAQQFGLNILNLTWEDTGRYQNSSVGPNISDMTIQVQQFNPSTQDYSLHLMPVIRYPNFEDKSADVPLDRFFIKVGNQRGRALQTVSLREVLGNPRRYLSKPNSWKGTQTSLLAPRDTHALVSAQACFLPIPQGGTAQFNPVVFNYQSSAQNPAVLTILASREGTSMTIIDNQRDGFEAGRTWGQRLFFNQQGQRASFTGQRISDFKRTEAGRPNGSTTSSDDGLNMVLLIQVPLKQKERLRQFEMDSMAMPAPTAALSQRAAKSDVEAAVIGHGKVEGPFTEIDNLAIERDPRYPIRVTVQFYKGTSNGAVSMADMSNINQQIKKVYQDADYVGSLVVDGSKGRPTEHDGPLQEPAGWWTSFWQRYERNTGQSRTEAMEMLRRLKGQSWTPQSEEDLRRSLDQIQ